MRRSEQTVRPPCVPRDRAVSCMELARGPVVGKGRESDYRRDGLLVCDSELTVVVVEIGGNIAPRRAAS
jgi:hypothetical protein